MRARNIRSFPVPLHDGRVVEPLGFADIDARELTDGEATDLREQGVEVDEALGLAGADLAPVRNGDLVAAPEPETAPPPAPNGDSDQPPAPDASPPTPDPPAAKTARKTPAKKNEAKTS